MKPPGMITEKIAAVPDKNGNLFEAYELRRPDGKGCIFIDIRMAECIPGGLEAIRNGISPHHMIVREYLE